ncbi:GDSL-type esterase/lipase family protein [Aporhodopirellula aestuarii]|uniref:beta-galactosidase n=1 Tax=Aporhodopirellula aestuarii TaxID=2950107 RepID=A0ABT0U6Q3_9BACT|nr:GDSL-type esterase/lipase family protein [Aporhodopirellula aestuarii]MCM2372605.1 GDSL-type esterase/lipase family protein [Aporhodopirellula aestuarii]
MNYSRFISVALALLSMSLCSQTALAIDLSGTWAVRVDPDDKGEKANWFDQIGGSEISLPGSLADAGIGKPLDLEPKLTKEVFHHLHPRASYIGAAWYSRTFEIDESWSGKDANLLFERVLWDSTVWLNGKEVGSKNSLSTPHRYSVGPYLQPGNNLLVVRVDNRLQVDIGTIGHAYTNETQTIWNGILGKIELNRVPKTQLSIKTNPLRVVSPAKGRLEVTVESLSNDRPQKITWSKSVSNSGDVLVGISDDKLMKWSEFDPALYEVTASFANATDGTRTTSTLTTGFRSVQTKGRRLLVNGNPAFMRGTLECCIFPKTGYPPMQTGESTTYGWDKVFSTLKQYGLNHLRFHSWCPPEAAFESADRHGVYLQVELPNWTFKMGQLPKVDEYLLDEGERILREYAHHPSFVFFSLGNELTGDYAHLDKMIAQLRSFAPHVLYTSTSYSFSKRGEVPGPQDDYFISQKTATGWVRGQGFLNQTKPTTDSDYSPGLECLDVPLITHEVGQYNVYPNLKELPKYDGNLRALNFEAIRADLTKKGRLDDAPKYTRGSGKLAAILYKEDIERALRTEGLSGIQLLDLHDFPGQSTATVGLLDAFWDSKELLTPAEFRRFCSPIVPLTRMPKRTWRGQERFSATIEVANFGDEPLANATVDWTIHNAAGKTLAQGSIDKVNIPLGNGHQIGNVEFDLGSVSKPSELHLAVRVRPDHTAANDAASQVYLNDWNFWVYPSGKAVPTDDVVVIRQYGKRLFDALADGKKVLFLPDREEIREPLDGRFIPVFWSPLHFPNQPGSLGTVIDDAHPVFDQFPTASHTDWQWWELLATSTSVNADELGPGFQPIMQFIDKYNRNSLPAILWETQVGDGSLMVCTLDLESDPQNRIAAAQLKHSILGYLQSDRFAPRSEMTPGQVAKLFQSRPYQIRLEHGTSHPDYPLSNLSDNDSKTIWHNDWRSAANKYPYSIVFDFSQPMSVMGMNYVARQDSTRGKIDGYRVSVSEDGKRWSNVIEGKQPPSKIRFDETKPIKSIRFEALSEVSQAQNSAIAELAPVFADGTVGVDELGLIPSFNQDADEETQPSDPFASLKKEMQIHWPKNRLIRFVFHGHSVPAGYGRAGEVSRYDSYPMQFHRKLCETYNYATIDLAITAIGGENAVRGNARFESDVLSLRPDVVFIDYSLNDRAVGLKATETAWRSMIEKCQAAGVPVVLLTPTPDSHENILDETTILAQHAEQVRKLAREYDLTLVDSYAAFRKLVDDGENIDDYLSQPNHPNKAGNRVVAELIGPWFW